MIRLAYCEYRLKVGGSAGRIRSDLFTPIEFGKPKVHHHPDCVLRPKNLAKQDSESAARLIAASRHPGWSRPEWRGALTPLRPLPRAPSREWHPGWTAKEKREIEAALKKFGKCDYGKVWVFPVEALA